MVGHLINNGTEQFINGRTETLDTTTAKGTQTYTDLEIFLG